MTRSHSPGSLSELLPEAQFFFFFFASLRDDTVNSSLLAHATSANSTSPASSSADITRFSFYLVAPPNTPKPRPVFSDSTSTPYKPPAMSYDGEPNVSKSHWLLVGGRGRPPTRSAFLRMASERKAAFRKEYLRKVAEKEAHAKGLEEHGSVGFMGFVKVYLGLKTARGESERKELIDQFGGRDKSLRKSRAVIGHGGDTERKLEHGAAEATPGEGVGEQNGHVIDGEEVSNEANPPIDVNTVPSDDAGARLAGSEN